MNKTLRRTQKDFKAKAMPLELRRAHIIIALLSMALAFIIIIISVYPIQLDMFLASVIAALLIIVAAVSLSIALTIQNK